MTARAVSASEIEFEWKNFEAAATAIAIERRSPSSEFTEIARLSADATTYLNGGLTLFTHYEYRLLAVMPSGYTGYSGPASARTLGAEQDPPVLSQGRASPRRLPGGGGEINPSIRVRDASGVGSVWALIYGAPGGAASTQLNPGPGGRLSGTWTAPPNLTTSGIGITIVFRASDEWGNERLGDFGIGVVQAIHDPLPVIASPRIVPVALPLDGGRATISAMVTDDRRIKQVWALLIGGKRLTLQKGADARYSVKWKAPQNRTSAPQSYAVTLYAQDIGLQTTGPVNAGTITVAGATPGSE